METSEESQASIDEAKSPSWIREEIVAQHGVLRELVAETVALADSPERARQELGALRARAKKLYEALSRHVRFEEQALPVALRDVIGWGAVLHAQMEEGHQKQRARLAAARAALRLGRDELVESVHAFATALLVDLEKEELSLLWADLDAITVDGKGG